ncbi:MAG: hypothetical protein ABSF44_02425 [Candidatus Bathyarchaeia archaeon]|jgi:Arc/MetJ-type ribon-helix-helix transcriptional regulator
MSELELESVTVKVPKSFLKTVKDYIARTGYYNDLNEFVMESLRERILQTL